jgi:hypothetical protein
MSSLYKRALLVIGKHREMADDAVALAAFCVVAENQAILDAKLDWIIAEYKGQRAALDSLIDHISVTGGVCSVCGEQ